MTRWRVTVYWPWRPAVRTVKQYRLRCKLCAIKQAMKLAAKSEQRKGWSPGTVRWTVERPDEHLGSWIVVSRYEDYPGRWILNHAH